MPKKNQSLTVYEKALLNAICKADPSTTTDIVDDMRQNGAKTNNVHAVSRRLNAKLEALGYPPIKKCPAGRRNKDWMWYWVEKRGNDDV